MDFGLTTEEIRDSKFSLILRVSMLIRKAMTLKRTLTEKSDLTYFLMTSQDQRVLTCLDHLCEKVKTMERFMILIIRKGDDFLLLLSAYNQSIHIFSQ